MADKLPAGYFTSDGKEVEIVDGETKEVVARATHPKGVIVGPHDLENDKQITLVCPVCNNKVKTHSSTGVCGGQNIQVLPGPAKVVDGKLIFTEDIYGADKGDVFRDDLYDTFSQSQWTHGGKPVVEGYVLAQNDVIQSKETHGKTKMEVA